MNENKLPRVGVEHALLSTQQLMVERFASGMPTDDLMEAMCLDVEAMLGEGRMCTVLLITEGRLRHGAAPSMDPGYCALIEGMPIGPNVGSCGTAAYRNEPVLCSNLREGPLWADYSEIVETFNLGSCWSIPIVGRPEEGVLGTFGVYGAADSSPTDAELKYLTSLAHVAGLLLSRANSERRLAKERKLLQQVVDGTQIGIWEWELETNRIWLSEEAKIIVSIEGDEPISATDLPGYVHSADLEATREQINAHLKGETDFFECELRIRSRDGWIWVLDRGSVLESSTDGRPKRLVGTLQDITRLKRADDEEQRIERLEGLGRVAGGLAHDFNNILVGVFGGIELAKEQIDSSEPAHADLTLAEDSLGRAKALTKQLLTFAKGGAPVRRRLDLGELVENVVRFDLAGSKVKPEFKIPDDLWRADIDPGQFQQVFSNLTLNAREATPGSGHLFIELQNVSMESNDRVAPGCYIRALFRDEGEGISDELLERIFDPYFTTKLEGSGLGLATVYSIVNRHGGHVSVSSTTGEGTTFEILLPATEERAEAPETDTPVPIQTSGLRVLVMDDQDEVLDVCSRMLSQLGHTPSRARDGDQALAILDESPQCDVAILDITIPGGRGGADIASDVRARFGDGIRLVASTGYTEHAIISNHREFKFDAVLPKPYTLQELARALSKVR